MSQPPPAEPIAYATASTPVASSNARIVILLVGALGFASLSFCFCICCMSVFHSNSLDDLAPWATSAATNARIASNASQGRPLFVVLLGMAIACGLASIGMVLAVLRLHRLTR